MQANQLDMLDESISREMFHQDTQELLLNIMEWPHLLGNKGPVNWAVVVTVEQLDSLEFRDIYRL